MIRGEYVDAGPWKSPTWSKIIRFSLNNNDGKCVRAKNLADLFFISDYRAFCSFAMKLLLRRETQEPMKYHKKTWNRFVISLSLRKFVVRFGVCEYNF